MDKNWLIRTRSNHILGPISKEKVLELYHNGSIKSDDEVCSGNGYWFYLREDDLVERFLIGEETQSFNPISEAKDVLTSSGTKHASSPASDHITHVGQIDLSGLKEPPPVAQTTGEVSPPPRPEAQPPRIPDAATATSGEKKKSRPALKPKKASPPAESVQLKKQRWLVYIGALGFVMLFLMIYFRKSIIQRIFQVDLTLGPVALVSVVQAQDLPVEKKKALRECRHPRKVNPEARRRSRGVQGSQFV